MVAKSGWKSLAATQQRVVCWGRTEAAEAERNQGGVEVSNCRKNRYFSAQWSALCLWCTVQVTLKGKKQPTTIHEVLARRGTATEMQVQMCRDYEEGYAAYGQKDWSSAGAAWGRGAANGDGTAQMMCDRLETLKASTAPFTGIWKWDTK